MATTPRGDAAARRPPAGGRGPRARWNRLSPRTRRLVGVGVAAGAVGFVGLIGIVYATADIPKPEELDTNQTTIVAYADGSEMLRLQGEVNRTDVPLSDVPDHVRKAVLAAEDRGYYDHGGISLRGIVRAAYQDVRGGGARQGGSTITQQYARNAFLSRERTFARKFREAIVAVKLDRTYSKDQVFEWYLNTIYFGRGAAGVEAAARTYFGVPAKRLTLEQGAVLAALIRSPEGGDPALAPETAKRRWRSVLDGMVEQGWLEEARAVGAAYPRLKARIAARARLSGPVGYLSDDVYAELRAHGFTAREIYNGGLRVRTTVDRKAQQAAVQAVHEVLDDPARDPNAALVAIEAGTGRVRAMYGGRDFAKRQFNYATDGRRQPGSAFKPIVLAAALDEGISLRTRFDGRSPQRFGSYEVDNFGDEQFGRIDLVEATVHSVNTIYVPLGMRVGVQEVLDIAHDLGIPERVDCKENLDATMFLGSCVQRPVDLADAYATFAARGRQATPYLVEEVHGRDGQRVYRADPKATDAVSPEVAADATYAMRQVVERGTARRAQIGRPAAGKTGTTQGNTDAWFAGYVPQLAAAVWLGFDPPTGADGRPTGDIPRLRNLHGVAEVTGGTLPAEIWGRFMRAALEGVEVQDFPPPSFGGRVGEPSPVGSATGSATPTPSATGAPTLPGSPAPTREAPPLLPSPSPSRGGPPSRSPDPPASQTPSPEPQPSTSP